jgi:hypothetical protein
VGQRVRRSSAWYACRGVGLADVPEALADFSAGALGKLAVTVF